MIFLEGENTLRMCVGEGSGNRNVLVCLWGKTIRKKTLRVPAGDGSGRRESLKGACGKGSGRRESSESSCQ